uniref:CARD domain-containing protein n=1 Tax=Sinocyclocheilus grahami TaxID=75366 RepID=A0A672Q9N5_SINGR
NFEKFGSKTVLKLKQSVILVIRVKMVMPIVDELRSGGMLEWEPYCKIRAADTNQKKMRELYEVLHSGGDKVKSAFYSQLEMQEPCLFRDLGKAP